MVNQARTCVVRGFESFVILNLIDKRKSWKKRYFVLQIRSNLITGDRYGVLQYYKNSKSGKLKGELALTDVPISIRYLDIQKSKKPFCFEIVKGFYTLLCQGKNEQEIHAWVNRLQQVTLGHSRSNRSIIEEDQSVIATRSIRSRSLGEMNGQIISSELKRILDDPKRPAGDQCYHFIKAFDARTPTALTSIKSFIRDVRNQLLHDNAEKLLRLADEPDRATATAALRKVVSRHVEQRLFLALHDSIYAFLRRQVSQTDDSLLNKKIRWLQGKEQSYFGIPLSQISWDNWEGAKEALEQMVSYSLPSDKLEALDMAFLRIRTTYQTDHRLDANMKALTTDDLTPIFTYVLVNSGVEDLLVLQELLNGICNPDDMEFPDATVLDLRLLKAAIEYINSVSIPPGLEEIFNEEVQITVDGDWHEGIDFDVETTYRCGAVIRSLTKSGHAALGSVVSRGYVLVSVSGTNVVLWPFRDIIELLNASQPPHRLAFIALSHYVRILSANKKIWNDVLLRLVETGSLDSVQMLLANGADINCRDEANNTPLHIATGNLHASVVSFLLQFGAKVKAVGECGKTPLHMVGEAPKSKTNNLQSSHRDPENMVAVLRKLFRHGAIVDEVVDDYGRTPLMLLAKCGAVQAVEFLLHQKAAVNVRSWCLGYTALTFAAADGHTEVVRMLLKHGANPNISCLRGETPLHCAAAIASCAACRVLVKHKALLDAPCDGGITPLLMAVSRGRIYHQNLEDDSTHVDISSVLATIEFLIDEGADIHFVDDNFRTPLHFAALYGGQDVVKLLLEKGVDPNSTDCRGLTALDLVSALLDDSERPDRVSATWNDWEAVHLILSTAQSAKSIDRVPLDLSSGQALAKSIVRPNSIDIEHLEIVLYAGKDICPWTMLLDALTKENYISSDHYRSALRLFESYIDFFKSSVNRIELEDSEKQLLNAAIDAIEGPPIDEAMSKWLERADVSCALKSNSDRYLRASCCESDYLHVSLLALDYGFASTPESNAMDKKRRRLTIAGVIESDEAAEPVAVVTDLRPRGASVLDSVAHEWNLEVEPMLLAQQLTLLDHFYFQSVPVLHFLHLRDSQEYQRLKEFHNHVSLWMIHQILVRDDPTERASALSYCIDVALKCYSPLRNYDGFMAIVNALNDSSIFRLKLTWARLSEATRENWTILKTLSENGARSLNKVMRSASVPTVPYVGLILQNLVSYQELPNESINIHRVRRRRLKTMVHVCSLQCLDAIDWTNLVAFEEISKHAVFVSIIEAIYCTYIITTLLQQLIN